MNNLILIVFSLVIFLFPFAGKYRYSRQSMSNAVISLGLLGTFIGITYGLLRFNPENITASIPELLNGMKTAIFTIITGVFTSLLIKLVPAFYGIRPQEPETLAPVIGQILTQLTGIKDQLGASPVTTSASHPENGPLANDKIWQGLLQKQSSLVTITQEANQNLQQQLQELTLLVQNTNKNLESYLTQSPVSNSSFIQQFGQLSDLVKNTGLHVQQRIDEIDLKRQEQIEELEKFTHTLMDIIKKLNQNHNTLYKNAE